MQEETNIQKVICVGWHKTGTSTIGTALIELGYEVVGARLDTTEALFNEDLDSVIEIASRYDALQDVPWNALYEELDRAFPGSKFILTTRDEAKWLKSATKHFRDTYIPMHEWLYGEGILKGNEELYLEKYREHNEDVLEYFENRPDDLLIMNFEEGDGWEKLCSFLDKPIPKKKFPHVNKGKHNYSRRDRLKDQLRSLTPDIIRKGIFKSKLFILKQLGYKDPRNKFNNFPQNRNARTQRDNK